MKFIRCVIEVRPFRLLVDCMAAFTCSIISHLGNYQWSDSMDGHLRTQQKHPHPRALGVFDVCVAFEAADCYEVWRKRCVR